MCAKSIDAAVAAAVAESVAAAEKAPGGATPVAWGAGKGRKEFGGAGSNVGAVGASTPAARTRPASAPLDMDSPAAARLVAAARETVTVHLVRPRKPTTSENNNNNLKPPVAAPPKPVPFQFQRRVRDEVEPATGIGAFAQLLPAMQEKLGMATHVVEVVGADGCVRRSDADFVDGEVCTVYGAADSRRAVRVLDETHDSTAVSNGSGTAVVASREGLVRLATASARMSRVVVNLIPTSSVSLFLFPYGQFTDIVFYLQRVKAMAGELEESPTEVTLPASCSTRVECVRVCEGALYKSKRICTPLLGLYAADGSSLGGVEGLLNGDVLLYRYLFLFSNYLQVLITKITFGFSELRRNPRPTSAAALRYQEAPASAREPRPSRRPRRSGANPSRFQWRASGASETPSRCVCRLGGW
jgi:hypothetical protein